VAFEYTFRGADMPELAPQVRDLLENRDQELELYLNQPNVKLRRVATQTITSGAIVAVSFDTEDSDDSGFFPGSGTTLTVPSGLGGLYVVGVQVTWSANPTGSTIRLRVNGNSFYSISFGNVTPVQTGSSVYLNGGDTLELAITQTSGIPATATATYWLTRVLA
jgi:Fe-S cluster assembly iron-binding protein IscA